MLFISLGSYGDVLPMVSIGKEFIKEGHEAILMTNGNFQDLALDHGFSFLQLGSKQEYIYTIESVNVHKPLSLASKLIEFLVLSPIDEMIEHMSGIPLDDLLIVSYPGNIGIKVYAEKYNIPFVSTVFAPILFHSISQPARLSPFKITEKLPKPLLSILYFSIHKIIDIMLCPKINKVRSNFDLGPIKKVYPWILSKDLTLGLFPEEFSLFPSDWPKQIQLTGFPLACIDNKPPNIELDHFVASNNNIILFTQGTPNAKVLDFFTQVSLICRDLQICAIFVSQFEEQLASLENENTFICRSVDFSKILPKLTGVVHHGGIGTTAQSLKAGIPQIIVPWGVDQFDNAKHLVRLGVGLEVFQGNNFQNRLKFALQNLLSNPNLKTKALEYSNKVSLFQGAKKSYDTLIGFVKKHNQS